MKRVVVVVIDSGGVGALADAASYGDAPGANTLGNVARARGGLRLPHLQRLGLGALTAIAGVPPANAPQARVARLRERSRGKDTITGHWEMTGVVTAEPFPTYTNGFPAEIIEQFSVIAGMPPLGNIPASGTEIIDRLGPEHLATGRPILYTSADSVFQIAAHEEVVPLERLYAWSEGAREMLTGPHRVNRVIARPFSGKPGAFVRTPNRRDYAVEPPHNLLDELRSGNVDVYAVGKIGDIYCGRSITATARVADNSEAMEKTVELLDLVDGGFIFTNLNDFDSKYGHRRDVRGYAAALEAFDATLPAVESRLRAGDELIITADHGCDPTAPGSDHTREYAPFIHRSARHGALLGELDGFDIVGRTVKEALLA